MAWMSLGCDSRQVHFKQMKILYGVCGEGLGHSSRAKTIIPYLESRGHEVKIIAYGQAIPVLKKEGFEVFKIRGATLKYKKGRLKKRETIKASLKNLFFNIKKSRQICNLMKEKFDLCISDFEFTTAILSSLYSLPLISLDNQHRTANLELEIPKKYQKVFFYAYLITKIVASKADFYIITSFAKGKIKEKYKQNTFIVPPVIRPEIKILKPKKENFVLVYLTKKDARIFKILKQIPEKFIVYGFKDKGKDKNIIYKKTGSYFIKDLSRCKAVIATAGFTLISEALYLKKPYLAFPLNNQFEQLTNALFLKQVGFGDYSDKPEKSKIENFLKNLEEYRKKMKNYKPDYNLLFKTLDKVLRRIKKEIIKFP